MCRHAVFSPDGKVLARQTAPDRPIRLADGETGETWGELLIHTFAAQTTQCGWVTPESRGRTTFAFAPDSKRIAVGSSTGLLRSG